MTNRSGRSVNTRDPRGWTSTGKRYKASTARYLRRAVRQVLTRKTR
jgi:hypothetical protein